MNHSLGAKLPLVFSLNLKRKSDLLWEIRLDFSIVAFRLAHIECTVGVLS